MSNAGMTSLELFAGGGGLALAGELAGLEHVAVSEINARACQTLRRNRAGAWPVTEGDCRDADWARFADKVDVLAGGPPCQPFSLGGAHRGSFDERDMFPQAARALAEVRPRAFVFENVRGLARASFKPYFDYILLRLAHPDARQRDGEPWERHAERLERIDAARATYRVTWRKVNAADYGVPQQRHRIFFVGFRSDLGARWEFPAPTHSDDALLRAQCDGTYWAEHDLPARPPDVKPSRLAKLDRAPRDGLQRWRTLRDATSDLPEPVDGQDTPGVLNHVGVPGARLYPGHTGSRLDWPAKSVKAGVHGVPGGEHIVVRDDGTYRYMTVRECARLQCFPDDWQFEGPRSEAMRQIGNAVPVLLGQAVVGSVARALETP